MGTYCDKCKKVDDDVKLIVDIKKIDIITNYDREDREYLSDDPHLCKECYKEFVDKIEKVILYTFGYLV
jgi:hypothetical protein